ncbi:uncharacterized protein CELE_C01A2.9 [Caenorhabditis elegans]|uniref:Uncharacterized protein n=1 Tax=Caenorhabditis elegans TaxID=6239 RepID=B0M0N1_CAEEL|nr:Uncharacterized protein CELE_C01A2.9 [Caenorhabditis elegans]CAP72360.2 Uncharacterized protein CELE_C01A2.9 [Caenorhabditis elegans]|eukprot:NP_001122412.2 Uncharacterized protein CELE_C01A2.9 [Caenorhabditis elegans]
MLIFHPIIILYSITMLFCQLIIDVLVVHHFVGRRIPPAGQVVAIIEETDSEENTEE